MTYPLLSPDAFAIANEAIDNIQENPWIDPPRHHSVSARVYCALSYLPRIVRGFILPFMDTRHVNIVKKMSYPVIILAGLLLISGLSFLVASTWASMITHRSRKQTWADFRRSGILADGYARPV